MNTFAYDAHDKSLDDHDVAQEPIPGRPRRRLINKWSVTLLAVLFAAVGFLGGIKIEKGQQTTGSTFGAATAGKGARATGSAPTFGGAPGGTAAGGGDTSGTVSSVSGKTIYLKSTSGDTVKVTLSSATKVSKSQTVSSDSLRPGDTIVVTGVTGSDGTISAATVTDSGASTTASSTASASTSASTSTAGSGT
jgi:hypothetical protein